MEEKYRFHPKAEKEFNDSFEWHENNRKSSGDEFATETFRKVDKIVLKPESRSADDDRVRWASQKNFPYKIYYFFQSPIVWILAIWHHARIPDGWKDRVKDVKE